MPASPALNGKAYPITDHTFDVVVVGATTGAVVDDGRGVPGLVVATDGAGFVDAEVRPLGA